MKAIGINRYGGSDELRVLSMEVPEPGRGELLIKVIAASVNPVDWKVREGRLKYITGRKFPIIMGTELSGIVEKTGPGVKGFKPGDRVFAGLSHRGGAYAEKVIAKEEKTILIPDGLDFQVAATLAVAGATPLQAFTLHYRVKKGDHVLVNNGAGGVGSYAIQIAKILGARVTAVCSERNIDYVKELGADEVIDYNREDFRSHHNTYDVVLDAAANAFFRDTRTCLRKGGMLVKLNISVGSILTGLMTRLFFSRKMKLILLKNRKEDLRWLIDHILSGKIRVHIDRTFPLERAKEAQDYSQRGRVRGKILIVNEQ